MWKSIVSFWVIYLTIACAWITLIHLPSLSSFKLFWGDFFTISAIIYTTWNVVHWIWNHLPHGWKEQVDPSGRAVVITGCDTGFGHELSKKLSSFGFHVYSCCLHPTGDGAIKLRSFSSNITIIGMDVTKDEDVLEGRVQVESDLKRRGLTLWSVVNNAGILASTEIEMGSMSLFSSQIEVNTLGVIRSTKAFIPLLRTSKGRVINVASLAGRFSIPGMVSYCVSKAGVISFSDGLRREMRKWDIDVVTIEPHLFNTNLVNGDVNHRLLQRAWDETPLDIKESYGESYFEGFKVFLNKVLGSARPLVHQVVDTMFIGVTDQFVSPSYQVMGDLEKIRVWTYGFIPDRVLDTMSYYASIWQTGQPAAHIKALIEKKRKMK